MTKEYGCDKLDCVMQIDGICVKCGKTTLEKKLEKEIKIMKETFKKLEEPFGAEWTAELMKWKKKDIVKYYRATIIERNSLLDKILEMEIDKKRKA